MPPSTNIGNMKWPRVGQEGPYLLGTWSHGSDGARRSIPDPARRYLSTRLPVPPWFSLWGQAASHQESDVADGDTTLQPLLIFSLKGPVRIWALCRARVVRLDTWCILKCWARCGGFCLFLCPLWQPIYKRTPRATYPLARSYLAQ